MSPRTLRLCMVTAELAPLAKTGGLADVSAALSAYLHRAGHEVLVVMPLHAAIDTAPLGLEPVAAAQDVTIALGPHAHRYGIQRGRLPGSRLPIHFIDCPALYHRFSLYTDDPDEHLRFILLARVAIELCQRLGFEPEIFHCHDWHAALVPLYLRSRYAWDRLFAGTRSVLTIHNVGYQGVFGADIVPSLDIGWSQELLHQDDLSHGEVNFLKAGVLYADRITTVSPTHARELCTPEGGMGLDALLRARGTELTGILNGVDSTEWDPATDPLLPANYDALNPAGKRTCKLRLLAELGLEPEPRRPLLGMISRLVPQKGIDLIQAVLPRMLREHDFAFAVLGSGEGRYEDFFGWLQGEFPGRVCFWRGYNHRLSHWIEAGCDLYLMPSAYEPCGLNQMYSLRYGTVPIVRAVGGLADAVEPIDAASGTGTGIVFEHFDAPALAWAIGEGLALYRQPPLWRRIVANGMRRDFSWERQGSHYLALYRETLGKSG